MSRRGTNFLTLSAFTILVITIQSSSWVMALTRSGYGEACSSRQRCIANSQLSCLQNVCNCTKPNDMVYHEESSKCLVRAGEKCKYALELDALDDSNQSQDDDYTVHNEYDDSSSDSNEGSWPYGNQGRGRSSNRRRPITTTTTTTARPRIRYEILDCVPTSTCITTGTCLCHDGYYADPPTGLCLPLKGYNGTCDSDAECESSEGLVCWEGLCGCNPNVSTYMKYKVVTMFLQPVSENYRCVGLPGANCINGMCNSDSECSGDTCVCLEDYALNATTNSCARKYSASCSKSSECHYPLECVTGICKCRNYHHQVFDLSTRECLSPVASPCETEADCVVNSKCGAGGRCECEIGYVEFGPGFCRKTYGTNCSSEDESSPSKRYYVEPTSIFLSTSTSVSTTLEIGDERIPGGEIRLYDKCDDKRNLYCRDGACQCETDMEIFSKEQGKCVGRVGSFCNVYDENENRENPSRQFFNIFHCADNAECIPYKFSRGIGRCACKLGWETDVDRTCNKIPPSTTTNTTKFRPSLFEPKVTENSEFHEEFFETHESY